MGNRQGIAVAAFVLGLVLAPRGRAADEGGPAQRRDAEPVRIGLIHTLFRDVPESMVDSLMQPFGAVVQAETGRRGDLVPAGDAAELGQMLADRKVDLGVFHGIEFAWAQMKHPELRPLVIAVNQQDHLRAYLLVRGDYQANHLAGLKGKILALPRFTREHCYVFLRHRCGPLEGFFGRVVKPASAGAALDDLVNGKVDVAVADGVCLEGYRRRMPARFEKLRVLLESEVFPATVIAYRAGALDRPTLDRVRAGLLGVGQTDRGRQLLMLWHLTGFKAVPQDYAQTVADIVKAYPPPWAVGTR